METWTLTLGSGDPRLAAFGDVRITSADLAGPALGYTIERSISIDSDAAGHGWSSTDLLTTVTHELGHVLGLRDNDHAFDVMDGELDMVALIEATGFDADPDRPITDAMLRDLAARAAQLEAKGLGFDVDWLAEGAERWMPGTSPYASGKAKDAPANVSEFFVKLAAVKDAKAKSGGFDSLGSSLLGAKGGKAKR
jgi:hypothetical protein